MKVKKLESAFQTRQQMESEDFEVFYYNDTELKTVKPHTHNYYEFYFLIDGDVTMTIKNHKYNLNKCDVIIIPPNTRHHANILSNNLPYKRIVLWLSENYINDLADTSPDYLYAINHVIKNNEYIFNLNIIQFSELRDRLLFLIDEQRSNRFGANAHTILRINDIVLFLTRVIYEMHNIPQAKETYSLYEKIIAYINTHIDENITLDELAASFYVSKYYISHLFKENTGISLHRYITKKRLALCRAAIEGGMSPTEASSLYGFKDYSGFFRAFKKEYGLSPNQTHFL